MNNTIKNQNNFGEGMQKTELGLHKENWLCAALLLVVLGASNASVAEAGTTTTVKTYEYDPVIGFLVAETINPDNAQYSVKTTYTYSEYGNILTRTVSSGATGLNGVVSRTETYTYDPIYGISLTSYKNVLGQDSKMQLDWSNLPLYVESLNGLATTWEYDYAGVGRVRRMTRPDNTTIDWKYSLAGEGGGYWVERSELAGTKFERVLYDALDRVVRTETPGFDGKTTIRQDIEYDNLGRKSRTSRPYYVGQPIKWTSYSYDILNRVTDAVGPDGAHVQTEYNGLTTTVTGPLGQTRTTIKNSQGQL
ncbi:hypothetical protein E4K72_02100, partial [Oxalobacteraceae bacterium OM1]